MILNIQNFILQGVQVKTTSQHDELWFCAADVCQALKLNLCALLSMLKNNEWIGIAINDLTYTFINYNALTKAIHSSIVFDDREADSCISWLQDCILPDLYKEFGMDIMNKINKNNTTCTNNTTNNTNSTNDATNYYYPSNIEKLTFAETLIQSDYSMSIRTLANILNTSNTPITYTQIFKILREQKFLSANTKTWNMPTKKAMGMELFTFKTTTTISPRKNAVLNITPRLTARGLIFFLSYLSQRFQPENEKTSPDDNADDSDSSLPLQQTIIDALNNAMETL